MRNQLLWLPVLLCLAGCGASRSSADLPAVEFGQKPTIVYKTKADYRDKVPVLLSEDGKKIVSYPAPSDLFIGKELAKPIELYEGYLLDRRGIGPRVAFLDISYLAYARLPTTPSPEDLMGMLLETEPLLECYDCGSVREPGQLNILIKNEALGKCKNLLGK